MFSSTIILYFSSWMYSVWNFSVFLVFFFHFIRATNKIISNNILSSLGKLSNKPSLMIHTRSTAFRGWGERGLGVQGLPWVLEWCHVHRPSENKHKYSCVQKVPYSHNNSSRFLVEVILSHGLASGYFAVYKSVPFPLFRCMGVCPRVCLCVMHVWCPQRPEEGIEAHWILWHCNYRPTI